MIRENGNALAKTVDSTYSFDCILSTVTFIMQAWQDRPNDRKMV